MVVGFENMDEVAANNLKDVGNVFTNLWNSIVTFFTTRVWNILLFILVAVVGFFLIRFILSLLRKAFSKRKTDNMAFSFAMSVTRFLLYLILILVLLSIIGIKLDGVLTAFSAALLAVGMALQANISNFASGLILVATGLYHKGDYIVVDGLEGKVEEITFLFTIIYTNNKQKVIIPNSKITTESVVNVFSAEVRRVDMTFSVAYETDVELVKQTVIETMLSDGRVKTDPKPFCSLKTLNESSIDFFSYCWCNKEDYWDVYYSVTERVFNEFKRKRISIPFAQMEVRLRTDNVKMPVVGKSLPKREEVKSKEDSKANKNSTAKILKQDKSKSKKQ